MEITRQQIAYLVLNKLGSADRERLQANLQKLAFFGISDTAHIVFTELRGPELGNALFPGIEITGALTVFRLEAYLELFSDKVEFFPQQFLTVFDK